MVLTYTTQLNLRHFKYLCLSESTLQNKNNIFKCVHFGERYQKATFS